MPSSCNHPTINLRKTNETLHEVSKINLRKFQEFLSCELKTNLGKTQEDLRKILRSFENRAPAVLKLLISLI